MSAKWERRWREERCCPVCGQQFLARSPSALYCGSRCKEKSRYARDREKRASWAKEYRTRNRDKILEEQRAKWNSTPPSIRSAEARKSYLKHRDRRIADALEYQKRNPDRVALVRNKRRATTSFKVTQRDFANLLRRHGGRCCYCNTPLGPIGRESDNSLQWDHIVPLCRGGVNSIGNLNPSCRKCNLQKGKKFPTEWRSRWYSQA